MHYIRVLMMSILIGPGCLGGLSAQVLPVLNSFSNRNFKGTVDVSWPVLFERCTFTTDSIVLRHSYGAVFRNCKFECTDGVLFIAESGDGIILADCDINGCKAFRFSRAPGQSDRNYVTDVRLDGEEYSVPDDQETITEIDGLELGERVTGGLSGPLIMMMSADRNILKHGESTELRVRGLEQGMFVGWRSSESDVRIVVEGDGYSCRVYAPDSIGKQENVIISAYTEYGLEAACQLQLMPDTQSVNVRKKRKG